MVLFTLACDDAYRWNMLRATIDYKEERKEISDSCARWLVYYYYRYARPCTRTSLYIPPCRVIINMKEVFGDALVVGAVSFIIVFLVNWLFDDLDR